MSRRWPYSWVLVVLLAGALATAVLTILSAQLASTNEQHLLRLRSREVGSALTSALPDIQTPLGGVVALADVTNGNPAKLQQFSAQLVGGPSARFASISVWRVGHLDQGPVAVVGTVPKLVSAPGGATAFLTTAATGSGLSVHGLLGASPPRLGYAYAGAHRGPFLVYAEQQLSARRLTRLPPNSAYSNLNISVYLGRSTTSSSLLLKTVAKLPLPGSHAETSVPFGNTSLTVVVSARQPLGGSFPHQLPWGIAIVGALLTLGAAALTGRLIGERRDAQGLAAENSRLYAEQRGIAQSLQHALLPGAMPDVEGIELATRYQAGAPGVEIGGDWYDLIPIARDRLLLVVGDVSGRGLPAATAMASLRFAIHYAALSESPEEFLPKLSSTSSLHASGQLATVLCVVIEPRTRVVSVTSAGHLPPLVVHDHGGEFLRSKVGPPIGVDPAAGYVAGTFTVPDGATLLAFTDGLVERRRETLDAGLDRLRRVAAQVEGDLEAMVDVVLERVRWNESMDDVAIAGVRWTA